MTYRRCIEATVKSGIAILHSRASGVTYALMLKKLGNPYIIRRLLSARAGRLKLRHRWRTIFRATRSYCDGTAHPEARVKQVRDGISQDVCT